jgi:hypothetical protein
MLKYESISLIKLFVKTSTENEVPYLKVLSNEKRDGPKVVSIDRSPSSYLRYEFKKNRLRPQPVRCCRLTSEALFFYF